MSKPIIHAEASAKKFGGKAEDYLKIHQWFDHTKAHFADVRHRAILHNTWGIFLCEQIFGVQITNSAGKQVCVRDIGEQHILDDLGLIPTIHDWLEQMTITDWMLGTKAQTHKSVEEWLRKALLKKPKDIDQDKDLGLPRLPPYDKPLPPNSDKPFMPPGKEVFYD